MRNLLFAATPLKGLFHDLSGSVKVFIREEVELAKSEMSEKMSHYSHNAISLAIGAVVAYAGLIVFLGGIGVLAGFGFQKLNMDPMLASFVGLAAVGLIVIVIGAIMVLKAVKTFSNGSLAPKRTIDTLKHLRRGNGSEQLRQLGVIQKEQEQRSPKRSPDELKAHVMATEDHIGDTLQEIIDRASPAQLKERADKHFRAHPYSWVFGALGGGFISALFLMSGLRLRGGKPKGRMRKQEWIAPLKISVRQLR
jgi:hypothetical protein